MSKHVGVYIILKDTVVIYICALVSGNKDNICDSTVKPVLSGPCTKRNFSYTEIFLCPVILRPKHMLNSLD
jgi:hypothetical protein